VCPQKAVDVDASTGIWGRCPSGAWDADTA